MTTFTIPGQPLPKARPRRGKNGQWYSPSKGEEARVAEHIRAQMQEKRIKRLSGPVAVTLRFYRSGRQRCDADNLSKLMMDSANGVIYDDDDQVVSLTIEKHTGQKRPRTEIEVRKMDG